METIAFIGTGLIGSGLIEAARARGLDVAVWNRTRAKADALAKTGARVEGRIEDAVRGAKRVHLVVSDDSAVESVLPGVLHGLDRQATVVDHTTSSPAGVADRARRASRDHWSYVHAPVFMSPAMAKSAKGMMLAAAPEPVFDRVKQALSEMTGDLWFVGERPDLAAAYKLFGNAMIVAITSGLADVFAMAKSLGIDPVAAHQVFSRFKPAGTIDGRGAKMAQGDYAASFELTMARKDVRLMMEAAGQQPLSMLPAVAARMDRLIAEGYGDQDFSVLAREAVPPR